MTPEQVRDRLATLETLRLLVEGMTEAAQDSCVLPRPGAFVKHHQSGKMFVVIDNMGRRTLDGFTDAGRMRGDVPWWEYDVVEAPNTHLDCVQRAMGNDTKIGGTDLPEPE